MGKERSLFKAMLGKLSYGVGRFPENKFWWAYLKLAMEDTAYPPASLDDEDRHSARVYMAQEVIPAAELSGLGTDYLHRIVKECGFQRKLGIFIA